MRQLTDNHVIGRHTIRWPKTSYKTQTNKIQLSVIIDSFFDSYNVVSIQFLSFSLSSFLIFCFFKNFFAVLNILELYCRSFFVLIPPRGFALLTGNQCSEFSIFYCFIHLNVQLCKILFFSTGSDLNKIEKAISLTCLNNFD